MSDAYKNIAAVLDRLSDEGVMVTAVDHDHDYTTGDGYATFELTVEVPAFESAEYRDDTPSGE